MTDRRKDDGRLATLASVVPGADGATRIAWPGRVAIFLAIFAAVRWLMRRIWHFGRGGAYMGCGRYRSGR